MDTMGYFEWEEKHHIGFEDMDDEYPVLRDEKGSCNDIYTILALKYNHLDEAGK
ncbi:MAG: hypothetical protein ACHQAX_10040 [Gammaproteobacteria bacterium]